MILDLVKLIFLLYSLLMDKISSKTLEEYFHKQSNFEILRPENKKRFGVFPSELNDILEKPKEINKGDYLQKENQNVVHLTKGVSLFTKWEEKTQTEELILYDERFGEKHFNLREKYDITQNYQLLFSPSSKEALIASTDSDSLSFYLITFKKNLELEQSLMAKEEIVMPIENKIYEMEKIRLLKKIPQNSKLDYFDFNCFESQKKDSHFCSLFLRNYLEERKIFILEMSYKNSELKINIEEIKDIQLETQEIFSQDVQYFSIFKGEFEESETEFITAYLIFNDKFYGTFKEINPKINGIKGFEKFSENLFGLNCFEDIPKYLINLERDQNLCQEETKLRKLAECARLGKPDNCAECDAGNYGLKTTTCSKCSNSKYLDRNQNKCVNENGCSNNLFAYTPEYKCLSQSDCEAKAYSITAGWRKCLTQCGPDYSQNGDTKTCITFEICAFYDYYPESNKCWNGCGQYSLKIPEYFFVNYNGYQGGVQKETGGTMPKQNLAYISNGNYIYWDNFPFGLIHEYMYVRLAVTETPAWIELRIDDPNEESAVIGRVNGTKTSGWQDYATFRIKITPVRGYHRLYVTFRGPTNGNFMNAYDLRFQANCYSSQCPNASYIFESEPKKCLGTCPNYSRGRTNHCIDRCNDNDYVYDRYKVCYEGSCPDELFTMQGQLKCVDECPDDRYIYEKVCQKPCPENYGVDLSISKGNTNYHTCLNCRDINKILVQNETDKGCQGISDPLTNGYFLVNDSFAVYAKCYSTCASCNEGGTDDDHKCTVCRTGLLFDTTGCRENCSIGFKNEDGTSCDPDCPEWTYKAERTGRNECRNCGKQGKLLIESNRTAGCLNKDVPGDKAYYYINQTANWVDYCYEGCSSCKEPQNDTNHNCLTCKGELYFEEGNCLAQCEKYFVVPGTRECRPCEEYLYPNMNTKTCDNCKDNSVYIFRDQFNEDNAFNGWQPHWGGSVKITSEEKYEGRSCLKISGRGNPWEGAEKYLSGSTFPTGKEFQFAAYAMQNTSDYDEEFKMTIIYTNISTGSTNNYINVDQKKTKKGQWVKLSNDHLMIPDGSKDSYLYIESVERTFNFYIDNIVAYDQSSLVYYLAKDHQSEGCKLRSELSPYFLLLDDYNYVQYCFYSCAACHMAGDNETHNCEGCLPTFLEEGTNCEEKCKIGYKLLNEMKCGECIKYLYSDNNTRECVNCREVTEGGKEHCYVEEHESEGCVEYNPDEHYMINDTYNYVGKCYETCKGCTTKQTTVHNCIQCKDTYVYEDTNCLEKCEKGYREWNTTQCIPQCPEYQYTNTDLRICVNCKNESVTEELYYVYGEEDKGCQHLEEDTFYFKNEEYNYVEKCLEGCKGCSTRGTTERMECFGCQGVLLYENTNCLPKCIEGYKEYLTLNCTNDCGTYLYPDSNTKECTNCKDISNETEYYYVFNETNVGCQLLEENTFYMIEKDYNYVGRCYPTCKTCTDKPDNDTSQNCINCIDNYLLEFNNCLEYCVIYWKDSESETCIPECPIEAHKTETPHKECINCEHEGKYFVDNETALGCQSESELKNGIYYINATFNYVGYCFDNCLTCSTSGDEDNMNCDTCKGEYYSEGGNCVENCTYLFKDLDSKRCIICPDYYYADNTTMECVNCQYVYDSNGDSMYLVMGNEDEGCIPIDELEHKFHMINSSSNYIEYCYETCGSCDITGDNTNHSCTSCLDEFPLYEDGNCTKKCLYKYKSLEENKCIICPEYAFPDNDTMMCTDCSKLNKYYVANETYEGCQDESALDPFYPILPEYNYVGYCYNTCSNCSKAGDENIHNCISCKGDLLKEDDNCEVTCKKYFKLLNENICGDCPVYLYPNSTGNYCQSCNETGQLLMASEKDKGCQDPSAFTDKPYYYKYEDKGYGYVAYCHANCSSCDKGAENSNMHCLTCKGSNLFEEGNCWPQCKYKYKLLDNKTCADCPDYLWSNPATMECVDCVTKNGYLVYGEKDKGCQKGVEHFFYLDKNYNYIRRCHSRCDLCTKAGDDTLNNCEKCLEKSSTGNVLLWENFNCVERCTKGYQVYKGTNCTEHCEEYLLEENSSAKCINCADSGQYLFKNDTSSCKSPKPTNTYYIEPSFNYIDWCHPNCATCKESGNDTSNNCLTCISGYKRYLGNCSEFCTILFDFQGRDECQNCEGYWAPNFSTRKCENCAERPGPEIYYYVKSQPELGCVTKDQIKFEKYYLMNGTEEKKFNVLEFCNPKCKSCLNGGTSGHSACYECEDGYEKNEKTYKDGTYNCESSCREGTYVLSLEYNICVEKCPEFLHIDDNARACVECGEMAGNSRLDVINSTDNKCVSPDPVDGYYIENYVYKTLTFNHTYKIAKKCHKNCKICFGKGVDSFNNCKECINGLINFHYNCISKCPEGFYEYNNECTTECPTFSKVDEENRICITCKANNSYFLIDNETCLTLSSIDGFFYVDKENKVISQCYETCATCSIGGDLTKQNCDTCKEDMMYDYGNCIKDCPPYKENQNGICYTCEELNCLRMMIHEKYCIDSICPENSIEEIHNYTDENGDINYYTACRTCKEEGLYVNSNKTECVSSCEEKEEVNKNAMMCIFCAVAIFEEKCVNECPFYTRYNVEEKECTLVEDQCIVRCYNEGTLRVNSSSSCEPTLSKTKNQKGKYNEQLFDSEKMSYDRIKVNKDDDNYPVLYNSQNIFEIIVLDAGSTWTWRLNNGNDNEKYYLNGVNEKIFVLNPYALRPDLPEDTLNTVELNVVEPDGDKITYKVSLTVSDIGGKPTLTQAEWNGTDLFLNIKLFPTPEYQQLLEFQFGLYFMTKYKIKLLLNSAYIKEMITTSKEVHFVGPMPTYSTVYLKIMNCYGAYRWTQYTVSKVSSPSSVPKIDEPDPEIENEYRSLLLFYDAVEKGEIDSNVTSIMDTFLSFMDDLENTDNIKMTYNYEDTLMLGLELATVNYINQIETNSLSNETVTETIDFVGEIISYAHKYLYKIISGHFANFARTINIIYKGIINVMDEDESLLESAHELVQKLYQLVSNKVYPNLLLKADLQYVTLSIIRIGHSSSIVVNRDESLGRRLRNLQVPLDYEYYEDSVELKKLGVDKCEKTSLFCLEGDNLNNFKNSKAFEVTPIEEYYLSLFTYKSNTREKVTLFSIDQNNEDLITNSPDLNDDFYVKSQIVFRNAEISKEGNVIQNCIVQRINGESEIVDDDQLCLTYYDYENKEILCKCNLLGTIKLIDDEDISNRARDIQYRMTKYEYYNYICYIFVGIIMFTTLILSIILLFYDYIRDLQITTSYNKQKEIQKIEYYFPDIYSAGLDSSFSLSFFFMKYHFSMFQIYYIESNTFPRYIKLHIEVFTFLAALIVSILPFYFMNYILRDDIVRVREYVSIDYNIHNLPMRWTDFLIGVG
ncbi:MAG: carbohydrate binding domain-containing protein, partial [archaeon]|nr:carbohydrate binding domain-containing protein [archaeon]